jgi:hypothetical protein
MPNRHGSASLIEVAHRGIYCHIYLAGPFRVHCTDAEKSKTVVPKLTRALMPSLGPSVALERLRHRPLGLPLRPPHHWAAAPLQLLPASPTCAPLWRCWPLSPAESACARHSAISYTQCAPAPQHTPLARAVAPGSLTNVAFNVVVNIRPTAAAAQHMHDTMTRSRLM